MCARVVEPLLSCCVPTRFLVEWDLIISCSSMPLIYSCPCSVLWACCVYSPPYSSRPNLLPVKSISDMRSHRVRVSVHASIHGAYARASSSQVTNHRIKDEPTAADRLMRRTCTWNHRCHRKYAFFPERTNDANESNRGAGVCFLEGNPLALQP